MMLVGYRQNFQSRMFNVRCFSQIESYLLWRKQKAFCFIQFLLEKIAIVTAVKYNSSSDCAFIFRKHKKLRDFKRLNKMQVRYIGELEYRMENLGGQCGVDW